VSHGHNPREPELRDVYQSERRVVEATKWLTERGDETVLHEERLEFVEWSILIFLVAGVILDCVIVYQGFHK
jgi:hypothetical protein